MGHPVVIEVAISTGKSARHTVRNFRENTAETTRSPLQRPRSPAERATGRRAVLWPILRLPGSARPSAIVRCPRPVPIGRGRAAAERANRRRWAGPSRRPLSLRRPFRVGCWHRALIAAPAKSTRGESVLMDEQSYTGTAERQFTPVVKAGRIGAHQAAVPLGPLTARSARDRRPRRYLTALVAPRRYR